MERTRARAARSTPRGGENAVGGRRGSRAALPSGASESERPRGPCRSHAANPTAQSARVCSHHSPLRRGPWPCSPSLRSTPCRGSILTAAEEGAVVPLSERIRAMKTSYHVHSKWSDGKTGIAEIITAAGEVGLEELGISDHYVLAPPPQVVSWSMPLDRLGEYLADVDAAAAAAPPGLVVRRGVEADFFPGQEAAIREALAPHEFDYVIGSVHYVDGFAVDESRPKWDGLSPA